VHQWDPGQHRGVVAQELGAKVVRSIDQHAAPLQQALGAGGVESGLDGRDLDRGVALGKRRGERPNFGRADSRMLVQDLAVQVALFHHVIVNHDQAAQASRGQRKGRTAAQSTRADQQDGFFK
jgi:hypothetical protein